MNIYQNIKNMCDQTGISTYRLCQELGFSTALMSQWKNGRQEPSRKKLQQIADYFKIPVEQLIVGDAETKKSPDNMSEDDNINKIIDALKNNPDVLSVSPNCKVPIVGSIACGTPILAQENIEGYLSLNPDNAADFCLICKGDSMLPRCQNGDLVLIRKQPTVDNGEIAAVRIGEEATLKKVYRPAPDQLMLIAENSDFPPIVLIKDEINTVSIEGKAIGFIRMF